jgi:hypothetical protein
MLIRAQDGSIYNLAHIEEIQVRKESGVPTDTQHIVEAIISGRRGGAGRSATDASADLARTNTAEEATALLDRIMAHKQGNLDLTKEPSSGEGYSF